MNNRPALTPGARVVRVQILNLEADKIGDRGTIRTCVQNDAGQTFGYTVEWDAQPGQPENVRRLQYVAPIRIAPEKEAA